MVGGVDRPFVVSAGEHRLIHVVAVHLESEHGLHVAAGGADRWEMLRLEVAYLLESALQLAFEDRRQEVTQLLRRALLDGLLGERDDRAYVQPSRLEAGIGSAFAGSV